MSDRTIAAVLFDLDGTLTDTVPDLALAVDLMLGTLGRAPVGELQVRSWVGNGALALVERALTGAFDGRAEPAELRHAYELFCGHYAEHLVDRSKLYPGVREGLSELADRSLSLGVVTNKPERFTLPLLAEMDLAPYFQVVVSGDSLPVKKPDPEPMRHGGGARGGAAGQRVVGGYSINVLAAARAAGAGFVCVPYGYRNGDDVFAAGPDAVIESLAELPALIEDWGTKQAAQPRRHLA
ncbi:MAG: phosphoglycolate phosphatase [Salinisphaera sp.]|nr:phosphoglycolate phosphatase [Salinisphaera sp.]